LNENSLPSSKSEFVDHIRSLLSRNQSIPYVTLSRSSTNISDSDLEKNLSQFIKILTEQYIEKQDKVRHEIENKQRYLSDFQQTQFNENKQLIENFQRIQKQFQILKEQYQQVRFLVSFYIVFDFSRRNVLVENVYQHMLMIFYQ
jgi:hypothetical protein